MTAQNSTELQGDPPATPRIHVVFIDHVARLSGGEIALTRLLPTLAKHVDVTVILGEDGPLVERLTRCGVHVEVLQMSSRLRDLRKDTVRPTGLDFRALLDLLRYVMAIRRRLKELDASVVHTNSLKAALYGGVAGRLAGRPVVWHIRDRLARDYLPRPAVLLVRLLGHVLPTAIVANSYETMTTIPKIRRRRVVYNAIDPDSVTDVPEIERHDVPDLVVGMIGRLTEWKGQDVFLRAFAQVFRDANVVARLVGTPLFGEEAYEASLHRLVEELEIVDQVEFRGFRDNVWLELREIDVLVHCSVRPEPFGQVVLEGMAAGVPVIAANAGGPAELITDGLDGLLTRPGDAADLASALRELATSRDKRWRIGAAGKARSLDFTPERTVERLLDVYNQVLSG